MRSSFGLKLFLCVHLCLTSAAFNGQQRWTTLSSIPRHARGTAVMLQNRALFAVEDIAMLYDPDADSWTSLSPAPTSLFRSAFVRSSSTEALLCGGTASTTVHSGLATVHKYSMASGEWTTETSAPLQRFASGSAFDEDGGKAYVFGGFHLGVQSAVMVYSSPGTWTVKSSMPTARTSLAGAVCDGILLTLANGYFPTDGKLVEMYIIATDVWETGTPIPTSRLDMWNVAVSGDFVYAVGGSNDARGCEMFDSRSGTWTTKDKAPHPHTQPSSVAISARLIMVIGDEALNSLHVSALVYTTEHWTTLPSVPSYTNAGASTSVGTKIVTMADGNTLLLDLDTWEWTTRASKPTAVIKAAAAATDHGNVLSLGGRLLSGTDYIDKVELYACSLDGWTSLTPMPTSDSPMGDGDGGRFYLLGGLYLHVYEVNLDQWTSRRPAPATNNGGGAVFTAHTLVVTPGSDLVLYLYSPLLDEWTTAATPPSNRERVYDGFSGFLGNVYASSSESTTSSFDMYSVSTDSWTALAPAPVPLRFASTAVTPSGLFIAVGSAPPTMPATMVFAYDTGLSVAKVIGDPEFTSFGGHRRQLHLWPGVFNLLTTPSLVVNAFVDQMDSLPVEENQVVTMVGLVLRGSNHTTQIDCRTGVTTVDYQCYERREVHKDSIDAFKGEPSLWSIDSRFDELTVDWAHFRVMVRFNLRHVVHVSPSGVLFFENAQWLDVTLVHKRTEPSVKARGLLLEVDSSDAVIVADYEVEGGCLMATVVPGTLGVFLP